MRHRGRRLSRISTASIWLTSAAFAALCAPVAVRAQDVPTAESDDGAGDIIVTARKRPERLSETPISITAYSAEALDRAGIQDISDLARATPGLSYGDFGDLKLSPTSLRGIVSGAGSAGAEPAIGYYVDEVYVGQGAGANLDLFDIDRVEVLRGPQGTLFGRNTIGGVISITTKKPSDVFTGSAQLEAGNYDYRRFGASLSGPILPGVSAKISGVRTVRDGYERNTVLNRDVNDQDSWSLRGQLLFDIAPDTELLLTAAYRKVDQEQLVFETLRYNEAAIVPQFLDLFGLPRNTDPYDRLVQSDTVTEERLESLDLAANFTTRIGDVGLTSITSYHDHDYYSRTDTDRSPLTLLYDGDPENVWRFSQELRLDWTMGKLSWLVGAYYFRQRSDNQSFVEVGDDLADALGAPGLGGTLAGSNGRLNTTSVSAFASATWAATDRIDLTLGGRYSHDRKRIAYTQSDPIGLLGGDANISGRDSWGQFTPNANIRIRFTPDLMGYATVSKGFKSGGFNDALGDANGIGFGPESLWNYEAGLKGALLDRRLTFDLSVFHMKWSDIQITSDNPATAVYDPIVRNAGKAHSTGVELQVTARPTDALSIGANLSVLEAEYDGGTIPAPPGSPAQPLRHTPFTPNYTGAVNADWRIPTPLGDVALYGEYLLRGRSYLDLSNSPDGRSRAYGLLNARASLTIGDTGIRVGIWGKNLTKVVRPQRLFDLYGQSIVGQKFIVLNEPRTYGLELRADF